MLQLLLSYSPENLQTVYLEAKANYENKKAYKSTAGERTYRDNINHTFDLNSALDDDYYDYDFIEITLRRVLKPFKISYIPLDIYKTDYTFYKLSGMIGKQSKIVKSIMPRKLELDLINLNLIEYKQEDIDTKKPYRIISLHSIVQVEEIPQRWYMSRHKSYWQIVQLNSKYIVCNDNKEVCTFWVKMMNGKSFDDNNSYINPSV